MYVHRHPFSKRQATCTSSLYTPWTTHLGHRYGLTHVTVGLESSQCSWHTQMGPRKISGILCMPVGGSTKSVKDRVARDLPAHLGHAQVGSNNFFPLNNMGNGCRTHGSAQPFSPHRLPTHFSMSSSFCTSHLSTYPPVCLSIHPSTCAPITLGGGQLTRLFYVCHPHPKPLPKLWS